MKPFASASIALAFALGVAGGAHAQERQPQGGAPAQPPGSRTQTAPPATPGAQAGPTDGREFVTQLAIAGMTEVQLGQMASERGSHADVKAFGQMMVKDHSQAGKELSQAAMQMNLPMPTDIDQKHKDLVDRLSKLQGPAFDREYMTAMVQGHEEVLSKLRARTGHSGATPAAGHPAGTTDKPGATRTDGPAAQGGHGDALTQWALKAEPRVQQHLTRAREIQAKVK